MTEGWQEGWGRRRGASYSGRQVIFIHQSLFRHRTRGIVVLGIAAGIVAMVMIVSVSIWFS